LQAYPGPALPNELQARILASAGAGQEAFRSRDPEVRISCVDGASTGQSVLLSGRRYPAEILVQPGRHYVRVLYKASNSSLEAPLWVDAQAGHTYSIRRQVRGYGIHFWLADAASGEDAAGGAVGTEKDPAPAERNCTAGR
jgi:hypothetical protein